MKKLITLTLIIVTVVTTFAGCKLTECHLCGDNAICQKKEVMEEEIFICKDCANELKELREAIN